jgi:hypothetical protein
MMRKLSSSRRLFKRMWPNETCQDRADALGPKQAIDFPKEAVIGSVAGRDRAGRDKVGRDRVGPDRAEPEQRRALGPISSHSRTVEPPHCPRRPT